MSMTSSRRTAIQFKGAISTIQQADLSYLPRDLQGDLSESFEAAANTFTMVDNIKKAEIDVAEAAVDFRPLHTQVRGIEREIRRLESENAAGEIRKRTVRDNQLLLNAIDRSIERNTAEIEELRTQIPAEWEDASAAFGEIAKAERTARNLYRRNVDAAAGPLEETIIVIKATDDYAALKPILDKLRADLAGIEDNEAAGELIREHEDIVKEVEGASEIRRGLGKARRAMSGRRADREKGNEELEKTFTAYEEGLAWRLRAKDDLLQPLVTYEAAIADTIALRAQPKLPREQALFVAACSSGHRDIGLNF